jgi:hypothetical protein
MVANILLGGLVMPNFEVNFHLKSGGTAKITFENISSASTISQNIEARLAAAGDKFQLSNAKNLINLHKSEMIGYSIEQV